MAPLAFYGEPERRVPVATTDPETLKQTIAAAIEGQVEETLTAMFDQKMVAVRSAYLKLRDRLGEQNAEVQEALTELRLMIDAPRTRQPVPEELEV
jgi:hypothetical protein